MYISYSTINGHLYAQLAESERNGNTIKKNYSANLGRVLDKEKGIYRNRERGVFTFDPATGTYGTVSPDFTEPPKRKKGKYIHVNGKKRSRLCIEFGNSFFLDEFLKKVGFYPVIDAVGYGNPDTLRTIIFYYLLSQQANSHAADWYELNYTRNLFPNAAVSSQRISEALAEIGTEESQRAFFTAYYAFIRNRSKVQEKVRRAGAVDPTAESGGIGCGSNGILIDSTGLPNSAHMPITAISNHNGTVSEEIRLIYVVQQNTGFPLFFSYIAGNVVDASTIKHVVSHLKKNGIETGFAILDAGYYNGINADGLCAAKISFITRVHSNNKVFTKALKEHRRSLECRENFVTYNGRFYYIKRTECMIGQKCDRKAYAYLGLDLTMREQQKKHLCEKMSDEHLSDGDIYDSMENYGLFMLVATRPVATEKILPLYYTRNRIEEIFRVDKGKGKLLPLRTATEETFCGHIMVTFIATVILILLQEKLADTSFTSSAMFEELRHQQGIVYDDAIVPSVAVKKMNDIYKLFKVKCPDEIPLKEHQEDR